MAVKNSAIEQEINSGKYGAVVFDFDGTIANLSVDWPGLNSQLRELAAVDVETKLSINNLLNRLKSSPIVYKKALKLIEKYELKNIDNIIINREIYQLIPKIHKINIRMAIFSNNMESTIDFFIKENKIKKYFDLIVGKRSVELFKPDPNGLKIIMDKFGLKNNQILFIGNDDNDLISGKLANIKTMIVRF